MPPHRTIVTFGAGPGIGNHTAAEFVAHGFTHVILLARSESRLQSEDSAFVRKASSSGDVKVDTLRVDLADTAALPAVLAQIDALTHGDELEVVFFNAARIRPSGVLEVPVEEIEEDFRVSGVALHVPFLQYLLTTYHLYDVPS